MTHIVELTREWTTVAWLCEACVEKRKAKGWTCQPIKAVEQLCDDCPRPPQPAAVDFVPTLPGSGSRLPHPGEVPPPSKIAWPECMRVAPVPKLTPKSRKKPDATANA